MQPNIIIVSTVNTSNAFATIAHDNAAVVIVDQVSEQQKAFRNETSIPIYNYHNDDILEVQLKQIKRNIKADPASKFIGKPYRNFPKK